jgi:hypothetical protein
MSSSSQAGVSLSRSSFLFLFASARSSSSIRFLPLLPMVFVSLSSLEEDGSRPLRPEPDVSSRHRLESSSRERSRRFLSPLVSSPPLEREVSLSRAGLLVSVRVSVRSRVGSASRIYENLEIYVHASTYFYANQLLHPQVSVALAPAPGHGPPLLQLEVLSYFQIGTRNPLLLPFLQSLPSKESKDLAYHPYHNVRPSTNLL